MEQETKVNAKEILVKLAKLQSDVDYIKEHIEDIELSEEDLDAIEEYEKEKSRKINFSRKNKWSLMETLRVNTKLAQANFSFIARYPSAMLVAGGILMALLDKNTWAVVLIGLGVILHILWLRR